MDSEFNSQNNEKVINIGTNNSPIYVSGEDNAEKNIAETKNERISNSTISTNITQNTFPQNDRQNPNHLPLIIFAIVAVVSITVVAIVGFAPSKQSTETINQNSIVNSTVNSQSNVIPQNSNVTANNSNKPLITTVKDNNSIKQANKSIEINKISKNKNKRVEIRLKDLKPNPEATPSESSFYPKISPPESDKY